jgi:Domain of unknown function (DUF4124)
MLRICINKCSGVWHVYSERWRRPSVQRLLVSGPFVKASITLLCLWWGGVAPGLAQIYRWTDDAGRVHFTDNPGTIPPERRKHSRQLPPDTTGSGDAADVPSRSLAPSVPTATADSPQPAASESAAHLQEQARTLEEQIAAALQERQTYLDQLNAIREVQASPAFGQQRRHIDELGRSLAAVERRLDTLYAARQQVQAKLQEREQVASPAPAGQDPQEAVLLDKQGHDRAYWRQRLEPLQARLRQAQEQRQAILAQLAAPIEEGRSFGRRGVEVLRHAHALERLEQDIRTTETALQALRQDAPRAGAPVEWLQ